MDCLPEGEDPDPGARDGDQQEEGHQDRRGCHQGAEGVGHRQGGDQAAEWDYQGPAKEARAPERHRKRRQRHPTAGVGLGRPLGSGTRSRQTPGPCCSPQEPPQCQCPLAQQCPSERPDDFRTGPRWGAGRMAQRGVPHPSGHPAHHRCPQTPGTRPRTSPAQVRSVRSAPTRGPGRGP